MSAFNFPGRTALLVTGAVILTLVVALIAVNFMSGEKKIERRIERLYSLEDPRFRHELGVLLGPQFVGGNRPMVLRNGDEIFPAMLAAIRNAGTSITFETYIYWSGDIGREFADALSERARHGVKVHVLLDWVGSAKMDAQLIDRMVAAGVRIEKFHPPHWSHLGRLNNRTHRKLLVVDGRVAFTGGVGIASEWTGQAQDPDHWRDTHFQVEGPVVAQMQAVFLDNWIKVTGDVLHGPDYFPALEPVGSSLAQMFSSSPSGGSESMQLMYLLAITSASRSIDLSAAYFVPDDLTLHALLEAIKRGVKLRIVVPGEHMDSETVRHASRARWGPLLANGAVIAEYQPTMFHCKVMIVDGLLVSVGSTNFDNRSFRLNDEATLNIIDADFANAQTAIFEADLNRSRQITYTEWRERPLREKIGERLASLFRSQL
ncbi:MAG: phospholipase D-like domain-containing protein [Rhodoferax sp.]|uniref:phospholipase D-like domain-containing protein n=1 Tax=Rhodoferax sp. TaxID=50421 RepID=UPI002722259F|nr:phospholipase D-like domain-containing protein [Rhodoferax sp.]MDO8449618.1 phospholipase D-like domain-containing protein [Rhodoferax sp.]